MSRVYIEAVPNRNSPPAILLRESYREGGKVRKRTLCNLSDWPTAYIEGLRGVLKGGTVIPAERDAFTVIRSLPHGHVAAALGTARKIGLDRILGPDSDRCRDLILALLVGRIVDPASKLATARALSPATAASSLGELLGLGEVDEDELYHALDWLLERQPAIEATLAKRHLTNDTLVLYDVSSSYMEGRCCPLAKRGYSRDGRKGTLQIVYGLLCAPDGCPIAIEVFEGNTADRMTLATQIDKLKQRFRLEHVVLVGDRVRAVATALQRLRELGILNWVRRCAESWRDGRFVLEQETNAYAVLPDSQWRGYRPPEPPPAPAPGTWGGVNRRPCRPCWPWRRRKRAICGPWCGILATDPKDRLAAALASLGRAFMARELVSFPGVHGVRRNIPQAQTPGTTWTNIPPTPIGPKTRLLLNESGGRGLATRIATRKKQVMDEEADARAVKPPFHHVTPALYSVAKWKRALSAMVPPSGQGQAPWPASALLLGKLPAARL